MAAPLAPTQPEGHLSLPPLGLGLLAALKTNASKKGGKRASTDEDIGAEPSPSQQVPVTPAV